MTLDEKAANLDRQGVVDLLKAHEQLVAHHEEVLRQLAWLKQQVFGQKSERRVVDADARQMEFGELGKPDAAEQNAQTGTVVEHQRSRNPKADADDADELRFDPSIPVEEVRILNPDLEQVGSEMISEKISYRLAQKPGSFVVLKIIRPVVKRADGKLTCPEAPGVLGKSIVDVSLLACLVIDKLVYHLPLYRQHQRMQAAGVRLARSSLTTWMHRIADLLEPIYDAQSASILESAVLAMDETPIKAGRRDRGVMKTGYFWPIFGERQEIVFPFSETRSSSFVRKVLGPFSGKLVTDGYRA